jgi:hypothetical protein
MVVGEGVEEAAGVEVAEAVTAAAAAVPDNTATSALATETSSVINDDDDNDDDEEELLLTAALPKDADNEVEGVVDDTDGDVVFLGVLPPPRAERAFARCLCAASLRFLLVSARRRFTSAATSFTGSLNIDEEGGGDEDEEVEDKEEEEERAADEVGVVVAWVREVVPTTSRVSRRTSASSPAHPDCSSRACSSGKMGMRRGLVRCGVFRHRPVRTRRASGKHGRDANEAQSAAVSAIDDAGEVEDDGTEGERVEVGAVMVVEGALVAVAAPAVDEADDGGAANNAAKATFGVADIGSEARATGLWLATKATVASRKEFVCCC